MRSKKKLLKNCSLYAIIDKETFARAGLFNIAKKLKTSLVGIIQFRDKVSSKESILESAWRLRKLFSGCKTIFMINDYIDANKIVDSDGIHLGQDDVSIGLAKKILGPNKIIGVSCHNLKQALAAQRHGADYISIGPIFTTPTKPGLKAIGTDVLRKIKHKIKIPFFAIGGINPDNLNAVLDAGSQRIAVCRGVRQIKKLNDAIRIRQK